MSDDQNPRYLALLLNGLPGWILTGVGITISILSILADELGLGSQPLAAGWKQWAGAGAGSLLAIAGAWIALRNVRQPGQDAAELDFPLGASLGAETEVYDSGAQRVPFLHELGELHRYRFLLWNLISRDLKVRYKRSVLGFLWAMINPLLTMSVIALVFIRLFRFNVENYPIYLLSGILIWRMFQSGTSTAMKSILGNSGMFNRIYIPPSVFVASSIGSAATDLLFALVPLLLLSLVLGVQPSVGWILLILPIIISAILALGVGIVVAALAVFFADVIDIYDVLLRVLFYLTPIIYPITILPDSLIRIQSLNPLHNLIDSFRNLLLHGNQASLGPLAIATLESMAIVTVGWYVFTRLSDAFPYRT